MEEQIRRRDRQVFLREFFAPVRLIAVVIATGLLSGWTHNGVAVFLTFLTALGANGVLAWFSSKRLRFHDRHFLELWDGCLERHNRFRQVYERGKRRELAGISEMPNTIEGVQENVYRALRKADLIAHELAETEGDLGHLPHPHRETTRDRQSQELLQVADRNIAEYRQSLGNLMAGVQRTEAQAAVFMTTLDTLRMRMLGHRLVGRSPEMNSHEFLAAMTEAKLQLQSIDKALDELDLGLYPTRVADPNVSGIRPTPPPIPPQAVRQTQSPEAAEDVQQNRA
jgi:hypothetical protein